MCFGDINDTISGEEKKGGNSRSFEQLSLGRNIIADCGLQDLGFIGYPFTWSNGRQGEEQIQCRLDRALAIDLFINRFIPIQVTHLPRFESDHTPLLICLEASPHSFLKKRIHLFRFEECWTKDSKCEDLVRRIWSNGNPPCEEKLANLQALDAEFKEYRTKEIR